MNTYKIPEPLSGTVYSKHLDKVVQALVRNNGYCPCIPERNDDTKCPCKVYRTTLECHCNLFIKVEKLCLS
jgi:hypothetical protein